MASEITHDMLVKQGAAWLKRDKCIVILTELVGGAGESPDVFGFKSVGTTVLIECKTSRSDFKADLKKRSRTHPYTGVGRYRYYLAPVGLIALDELPAGWGLLESTDKRLRVKKVSDIHEYNELAEKAIMVSMVRRLNLEPGRHTSLTVVSPYTFQTKCKATLTVNDVQEE